MQASRLAPAFLAVVVGASVVAAQSPLCLGAGNATPPGTAGAISASGNLQWVLGDGALGSPCAVTFSTSPGYVPIALFDPPDSRLLLVDLATLGPVFGGIFGVNGKYMTSPIPITNPTFAGLTLYCVGFDLGSGLPGHVINRISNPLVVRLALQNTVRSAGQLNLARAFGEVVENGDGRLRVCGGGIGSTLAQIPTKTTEVYDQTTDTWSTTLEVMTTERTLFRAVKMLDGRYLLCGGMNSASRSQSSAEIWDPVAQTFTAVASMSTPRSAYRPILLPDGRVLVMGGFTAPMPTMGLSEILVSSTNTTEIYDPATDTWTAGPSMSVPRATFEVVDLGGGKWLVCGGEGPFNHPMFGTIPLIYSQCDIYDAASNTFTPTGSMVSPHAAFASVKIGNKVVVSGGGDVIDTANPAGRVTKVIETYDIATGVWAVSGMLATERAFHFAFDLGNSRSIHIGGANGNLVTLFPLASTEIYDDSSGMVTAGPTLPVATNSYGPYVDKNGEILLVGGAVNPSTALPNTTVYYR